MYHVYTTEGFVLGSKNVGEANKLYFIFTRELGLVTATAQGVRLLKSKLRSNLQDLKLSTMCLVRGKDMWRITGSSESKEGEFNFENRQHFILFARILSLLKRLLHGEEKNAELFDVIKNGFIFLKSENLDEEQLGLFESILVSRILYLLGYMSNKDIALPFSHTDTWNLSLIEEMKVIHKDVIREINRSLKESQL